MLPAQSEGKYGGDVMEQYRKKAQRRCKTEEDLYNCIFSCIFDVFNEDQISL